MSRHLAMLSSAVKVTGVPRGTLAHWFGLTDCSQVVLKVTFTSDGLLDITWMLEVISSYLSSTIWIMFEPSLVKMSTYDPSSR